MIDLAVGAAAGVVGSATTEMLHVEPGKKSQEDLLVEICETLHLLHEDLTKRPATKIEEHETLYTYMNNPYTVRYKNFLAVYILVAVTSTFTVSVSGLGSFTWTPTPGTYTRWQFPEGSTITLLTPSQSFFPIDILYSNDLEN